MEEDIRYIRNRWLNKPYKYIAIHYKKQWLHYQRRKGDTPMNIRKLKIIDMPKLESPFVRKIVGKNYDVTPEIQEGYEWVFEDDNVAAIEKLHGTNCSVLIIEGQVTEMYNRTERVPFINKGKAHITHAILNSKKRGYLEFLGDGQHFGEVIGPKINGNPYKLEDPLFIPFGTYCQKHLRYKSWGQYPKDFDTISNWFENDLFSLFNRMRKTNSDFVEGIVFTHPDGRMAKLRRDMFSWFKGRRH